MLALCLLKFVAAILAMQKALALAKRRRQGLCTFEQRVWKGGFLRAILQLMEWVGGYTPCLLPQRCDCVKYATFVGMVYIDQDVSVIVLSSCFKPLNPKCRRISYGNKTTL